MTEDEIAQILADDRGGGTREDWRDLAVRLRIQLDEEIRRGAKIRLIIVIAVLAIGWIVGTLVPIWPRGCGSL